MNFSGTPSGFPEQLGHHIPDPTQAHVKRTLGTPLDETVSIHDEHPIGRQEAPFVLVIELHGIPVRLYINVECAERDELQFALAHSPLDLLKSPSHD